MGLPEGKVSVVSGGTSGVGARSAEFFVSEGANVVIAGRRLDRGEQLAYRLGKAASFIRAR
jgi:NADP-dependent 3-hydroxy acid dehydrogenase YdfG